MGLKKTLKKFAKFVLNSDNSKVSVNIVTVYPNEELKDKNIVITGGNRGIGYAIAKKCLDEGANVIIVGRNEENLKSTSKELGKKCNYVVHDIENIEKIEDLFVECKKIAGGG